MVTGTDMIGIPSRDPERARDFYRDVLGLRPDPKAAYEQWAGETCFSVWEPEKVGMTFTPYALPAASLRVDDVHAEKERLEGEGVRFFGDVMDSGVCHMAIFADPDGNAVMLHKRYAPH